MQTQDQGTHAPARSNVERPRLNSRRIDVALALLVAVVAMGSLLVHVHRHHDVSPYDEYIYLDAVDKAGHGSIVRDGQRTDQFARSYLACNEVLLIGPFKTCGLPTQPDSAMPYDGKTGAGLYSPLFYFTTRAVAEPLRWAGVSLVSAARIASGLWVVLAAVLMFAVARLWRVPRTGALAASGLLLGAAATYWAGTFVTTDAPEMAFTLALLGGAWFWVQARSRRLTAALLGVSLVAGLIKVQCLESVAIAALWMATVEFQNRAGLPLRRRLRCAGLVPALMLGVAIAAQGVWLVIRSAIAVGTPPDVGLTRPLHAVVDLTSEVQSFLPGAVTGADFPLFGHWVAATTWLLGLIVVGGVLAASFRADPRDRALGRVTLLVALVSGPAMALAVVATTGGYVPNVWRYGVPLIPAYLLCAARALPAGSRIEKAVVSVIALGSLGVALTIPM